jgi:hypothetical protein
MAEGEREFLNARADVRVSVDEYRELDSQRVLVLLHGSGRGKTSSSKDILLSAATAWVRA